MTVKSRVKSATFQGLDVWIVENDLSTAIISTVGGQVLSWRPKGLEEVLWLSPSVQSLPKPIRGGIPICWPYFARQGQSADMPAHGVVRTIAWELLDCRANDDDSSELTLSPVGLGKSDLSLRMELTVGRSLTQRLITCNVSAATTSLTQAMHNYFLVSDVSTVRVEGVSELTYQDKYAGGAHFRQQGDWVLEDQRDPGRSDRIYGAAPGRYVIHDQKQGRKIILQTTGSQSVVIWSPGQEVAEGMPDVGSAWKEFLCVETANAGDDSVLLAAGQEHVLTQKIDVF